MHGKKNDQGGGGAEKAPPMGLGLKAPPPVFLGLTLYSGGGGGGCSSPPSTFFAIKSAVCKGLARFQEFFPYRFAHTFETKLVTSGYTVTKLRNF